jgi:hypothetical protein
MGARRRDESIGVPGDVPQVEPKVAQVLHGLPHRAGHVGRHLDDGLKQFRLDALLLLAALEGEQDLVDPRDELVALAVQDLELLLDAEAERRALAEVLLHANPRQ